MSHISAKWWWIVLKYGSFLAAVTVTVGYSDTFANPRGCHCNRRPLYAFSYFRCTLISLAAVEPRLEDPYSYQISLKPKRSGVGAWRKQLQQALASSRTHSTLSAFSWKVSIGTCLNLPHYMKCRWVLHAIVSEYLWQRVSLHAVN